MVTSLIKSVISIYLTIVVIVFLYEYQYLGKNSEADKIAIAILSPIFTIYYYLNMCFCTLYQMWINQA